MSEIEKFEYRKGKRVLVAWKEGDIIKVEEYIDGTIFMTMPIPKNLMESVLNVRT